MGVLCRSCRRFAPLLYQCRRRRCYFSAPTILWDKPTLLNCISLHPHSPSDALLFFARNYGKQGKGSHNTKQVKEVESDDYRKNEQITADPIRLVTDIGHQIVSRREALDYAKKVKLDLVEVQFNANPPVCKVMDYNLEKFNQRKREKEREKNKAEGLRNNECREIRFAAKTEQRDLERKAEMAKQLLDRGCRVKCMVMGTGEQNLAEQLQRFLILIEDVSDVEYGPRIEQRNGYFIARHIKFGFAIKKEAQKTIKSVENGKGKTDGDNIKNTNVSEKKKDDTSVLLKEEFIDKSAQFEELAPVEQFEEIVDEFLSIDTAEAIPNGICLSTSETKMHTVNTIQQQEPVVGDTNHYSETETFLKYSSRNHDQSLKQCRDATKVKDPEFLKKGHFSLPLTTNLNNGPEKQHQHGMSDGKLSESASREAIFGRNHSDQGHCAANVGKVHSADSHFKANVKDIPNDYHINASTSSEVTKSIVEKLQTTPATLNDGGAIQEQQPRVQISADSLRQALVKRSSGDQHTSKTEKRPLSDLLLKQASESRWAVLRQVKPSRFDDNTNIATPSITTNFVENLQTSHANLNNDTATQVQQKMTTGSSKIPADDQEENALKARMQPSTNMLSEQANEFQWATLRQVKTSHFEGDNTGRQDELGISNAKHHANQEHHVSDIGQIPVSSVSLPIKVLENGSPYIESGVANAKQPSPSEHEKKRYFDPNKAIQKPLDSTPKLDNNTGDSNAMSRASSRILDAKIQLVDTRQVPSYESHSGEGNRASSTGKQDPTDSFSKQVSAPVGSHWPIFSQPKGYVVENQRYPAKSTEEKSKDWSGILEGSNMGAFTEAQSNVNQEHHVSNTGKQIPVTSVSLPTKVLENGLPYIESGIANAKQRTSSEREKQWYFKLNKAIQKPLDSNPKLDNNTGDSNAMSRASLRIMDAKTIRLVDTRQAPSYESCSCEGNHASNKGKKDPTDLFSKQDSAPVGSHWGIFSQPKSYVVENQRYPAKATEEKSKDWSGILQGPSASAEAQSDNNQEHQVSNTGKRIPVSSVSLPTKVLENGSPCIESDVANVNQPSPSEHEKQCYFDPNKAIQKPLDSTLKLDNSNRDSNATSRASLRVLDAKTIPLVDTRQVPSYESPSGEGNHASSKGKQDPTDSFSKQDSAPVGSHWGIFSQPKGYVVENQRYPPKATQEKSKDWCGILVGPNKGASGEAKSDANQEHHVSNIGKQIPVSSVSLPTKALENGSPYIESGVANAKQLTPSEHEKQFYFGPDKAIQKPLDSTPKLDNNTGNSNAMSRASLKILDAKTTRLVDTRQVPSYESPSGEGNHASSTEKKDPTDSFSKQVSASRWGIFSQPKGYVVENQRYPAKATEAKSKDWSGVLEGTNTGASVEAQSDLAPRHLHSQNQIKVPTSSMGIGKQDQKQTERDVDQPRQKGWGIFSMKVPTKDLDDKRKSEI